MNKQDTPRYNAIKSGFVVKVREGFCFTVMRVNDFTKILVDDEGDWSYLSNWNNELKAAARPYYRNETPPYKYFKPADKRFDIVEIYGLLSVTDNYGSALCCRPTGRPLVWKRWEPIKMTLSQVEDRLGFPIELISDNE